MEPAPSQQVQRQHVARRRGFERTICEVIWKPPYAPMAAAGTRLNGTSSS